MIDILSVWGFIGFVYWASTRPLQQQLKESISNSEYENVAHIQSSIKAYQSAAGFAALGGLFGSFVGIAGFGSAVAGTVPIAIVGWIVGWSMARSKK